MKFPFSFTVCFSSSRTNDTEKSRHGIKTCLFLKLVLLEFVFFFVGIFIVFWTYPDEENQENFRVFNYDELKSITNGFHSSNKVGEGGFGIVYQVGGLNMNFV